MSKIAAFRIVFNNELNFVNVSYTKKWPLNDKDTPDVLKNKKILIP
jgi:hypothetical protein